MFFVMLQMNKALKWNDFQDFMNPNVYRLQRKNWLFDDDGHQNLLFD